MLKIIFNHFSDDIQKLDNLNNLIQIHWIIWYKWIIFVPGILSKNILHYLPHNSCILASLTLSHNNFICNVNDFYFGRLMKGKLLNLSMAGIASATLRNVILQKYCKNCLILSTCMCRVGFFQTSDSWIKVYKWQKRSQVPFKYIRLRVLKQ